MSEHKTDPSKLPRLGRMFLWVDKPGSANKLFWGLAATCAVLFLLDFAYTKHPKFDIEYIPGFYGIYGFVMFTLLIFAAKGLRVLIKRPEDYYGDKVVDCEEYPADQLAKETHDGL